MPDLKDRRKREETLAASLLMLFEDYKSKIPNDVNWNEFQSDLESVLAAALEDTSNTSFQQIKQQINVELDEKKLKKKSPENWASDYSKELAALIVATTQDRVKQVEKDGKELDLDYDFSEERAQRIAITETTRAVTAGEYLLLSSAIDNDLIDAYEARWHAELDALTCQDCQDLDGMSQSVWEREAPSGPPLHPDCRCTLEYDIPTS